MEMRKEERKKEIKKEIKKERKKERKKEKKKKRKKEKRKKENRIIFPKEIKYYTIYMYTVEWFNNIEQIEYFFFKNVKKSINDKRITAMLYNILKTFSNITIKKNTYNKNFNSFTQIYKFKGNIKKKKIIKQNKRIG
ncbi:hypothetical protein PFAG_01979 [Plasmodium falciparum Santa Lucia]|uniref:Uncharacterized protein n=1 Tax=Plasmodium falciparum Santa Lucia TaxID=478859 RepID=W7FWK4_PLAFA|nr:hypothetical protein PFAG_01979 [Plasmodium falciparum Santa Lucia]